MQSGKGLAAFALFWLAGASPLLGTAWVQGQGSVDSIIPGTSRTTVNWSVYASEFNISPGHVHNKIGEHPIGL